MALTFQLNGSNLTYITQANWQEIPVGQYLNGQTVHHRWRVHTWQTNVMTAAEFDTLYAQQGAKVSITTVPYDDRNASDYVEYFGAELKEIEGEHNSTIVENVMITFRVRV